MFVCSTFTDRRIRMLLYTCASIKSPSGKIRLSILKLRIGASYLNHPFNSITHPLAFSGSHEPPGRNQPLDRDLIDVVGTGGLIKRSPLFMIESMSAMGWAGFGCVCEKGCLDCYLSKWSDATLGWILKRQSLCSMRAPFLPLASKTVLTGIARKVAESHMVAPA